MSATPEFSATSPRAFAMSAGLHGVLIALALLVGYATREDPAQVQRVLELVAGEGDNYMATEAPALGTSGGVKLDLPAPPEPKVEPAPPRKELVQETAPTIVPAPPKPEPKVTPAPKPVEKPPDFTKKIKQDIRVADRRAKQQVKKQREAEAKRAREAEAKRLAEEEKKQKQMTKEEFDRLNKGKTSSNKAPVKTASVKIPKIDAAGIAKGVVGGSTRNTKGGAGGRALTANPDDVLAAYFSMFKTRLREKFVAPPTTSDSHRVTISVRNEADGRFVSARVVKSSGNKEFDDAVLEALRHVSMPARPDDRSETVTFEFSARERDDH